LFTVFVAQTNRVGFEDGLCYWGGSAVLAPDGHYLAQGPDFEEALVVAEIDPDRLRRARLALPLLRDERPELLQSRLARLLENRRHGDVSALEIDTSLARRPDRFCSETEQAGFSRVVGVSGGIDRR
jgi:hypothetical protein